VCKYGHGENEVECIITVRKCERLRVQCTVRIIVAALQVRTLKAEIRVAPRKACVGPIDGALVDIKAVIFSMKEMRYTNELPRKSTRSTTDVQDGMIHLKAAEQFEVGNELLRHRFKVFNPSDICPQRTGREILPGYP
jgi:hypothetical protein